MADFVIGKIKAGTTTSNADAISAMTAFTETPEFKKTMLSPDSRDEFIKGLEFRYEQALANNQRQNFELFGAILKKAKSYKEPVNDIYSNDTGFRAIG